MRKTFGGALASVLLPLFTHTADAQVRLVAEKLGPAPGGGLYATFPRTAAVSDAAGPFVAFNARRKGVTTGTTGIFADDDDPLTAGTAVALKDQASSIGAQFTQFGVPSINASSQVVFSAKLRGGTQGVFVGTTSTVVLKLDDAPAGMTTAFFKDFAATRITDAGDVVFRAELGDAPVVGGIEIDAGIYRCGGSPPNCSSQEGGTGTLTAVALVGDRSDPTDPGSPAFCELGDFDASDFGVVVRALTKVDCTDVGESALYGIFRISVAGVIETLALEGQPSEPAPPTTSYLTVEPPPAIANNGMVAFNATIAGLAGGLFRCDPAVCPGTALPVLAVQAGVASAADQPADNDLTHLSAPGVSNAGDIAFQAILVGPSGQQKGVFVHRAGSGLVETFAIQNGPAPRNPPDPDAFFRKFYPPTMSSGGRAAFRAITRTSDGNRRGVYVAE
jgi:hypothetical protein